MTDCRKSPIQNMVRAHDWELMGAQETADVHQCKKCGALRVEFLFPAFFPTKDGKLPSLKARIREILDDER